MKRYCHLALLTFYFAFAIGVPAGSPEVGVFSESVLVDALEKGRSLIVAEILSVREDAGMYYYNAEIVRPIILGDLEENDLSGPLELFAGASYGKALKTGSIYVLFVTKDCPYYFSWAHRDSIQKVDVTDEERTKALVEAAERAYAKTSIRKFRQGWRPVQEVELPALSEGIVSLCEQFRTDPESRTEIGKKIFESDLGSRRDESNPQSSIISYLPPRVSLSREQLVSLLGRPNLRSGWTYSWLCGQVGKGSRAKEVGVLSATFDKSEAGVRVLYQRQEKSKWTKFTAYSINRYVSVSGCADTVPYRFQRALKDSDWDMALSFCSKPVKAKAKEYNSAEAFFKDFMPLERIVELLGFYVRGHSSSAAKITSLHFDEIPLEVSGAEWPVNWKWSLVKDNDRWLVDFKTMPVEVLVKKELLRRELEHEDANIRMAKFEQGVEFRLTPLAEEFVVGQPMLFRIQMTNTGDDPILYMATGPRSVMTNDPMIVIGPNGETVDYVDTSYQIMVWSDVILPGETIDLVDSYDVTTQYAIIEPGRYTFQFKDRPHQKKPSNIVQKDVKPGELSPADSIAERLSAVLPGGWTLTRRLCGRPAPTDRSLQSPICVHMVGKRRGKAIDVDIFLMVHAAGGEITLVAGFTDQLNLWGRCKWGTIYGRARNAEDLWPDYEEQIFEALEMEGVDSRLRGNDD